jgi:glucose-6-phosphate 1-dehydrogenase
MSSVEVTIDHVPEPVSPKAVEPCIIVIFGATGDLSRRKLVPALFDLVTDGLLTADFEVLGVGRSELNDEKFRDMLRDGTERSKDSHHFTPDRWQ